MQKEAVQCLENREVVALFDEQLLDDLAHAENEEARKKTLEMVFTAAWKSPKPKIAATIADIIKRLKRGEQD